MFKTSRWRERFIFYTSFCVDGYLDRHMAVIPVKGLTGYFFLTIQIQKCLAVTWNQTQDHLLNAQALCHWATTTIRQPNTPILYLYCWGLLLCYSLNTELKCLLARHSSVAECLCVQAVLGSIPGDSQTFLNSVLTCERERIHLMWEKKKTEKEIVKW